MQGLDDVPDFEGFEARLLDNLVGIQFSNLTSTLKTFYRALQVSARHVAALEARIQERTGGSDAPVTVRTTMLEKQLAEYHERMEMAEARAGRMEKELHAKTEQLNSFRLTMTAFEERLADHMDLTRDFKGKVEVLEEDVVRRFRLTQEWEADITRSQASVLQHDKDIANLKGAVEEAHSKSMRIGLAVNALEQHVQESVEQLSKQMTEVAPAAMASTPGPKPAPRLLDLNSLARSTSMPMMGGNTPYGYMPPVMQTPSTRSPVAAFSMAADPYGMPVSFSAALDSFQYVPGAQFPPVGFLGDPSMPNLNAAPTPPTARAPQMPAAYLARTSSSGTMGTGVAPGEAPVTVPITQPVASTIGVAVATTVPVQPAAQQPVVQQPAGGAQQPMHKDVAPVWLAQSGAPQQAGGAVAAPAATQPPTHPQPAAVTTGAPVTGDAAPTAMRPRALEPELNASAGAAQYPAATDHAPVADSTPVGAVAAPVSAGGAAPVVNTAPVQMMDPYRPLAPLQESPRDNTKHAPLPTVAIPAPQQEAAPVVAQPAPVVDYHGAYDLPVFKDRVNYLDQKVAHMAKVFQEMARHVEAMIAEKRAAPPAPVASSNAGSGGAGGADGASPLFNAQAPMVQVVDDERLNKRIGALSVEVQRVNDRIEASQRPLNERLDQLSSRTVQAERAIARVNGSLARLDMLQDELARLDVLGNAVEALKADMEHISIMAEHSANEVDVLHKTSGYVLHELAVTKSQMADYEPPAPVTDRAAERDEENGARISRELEAMNRKIKEIEETSANASSNIVHKLLSAAVNTQSPPTRPRHSMEQSVPEMVRTEGTLASTQQSMALSSGALVVGGAEAGGRRFPAINSSSGARKPVQSESMASVQDDFKNESQKVLAELRGMINGTRNQQKPQEGLALINENIRKLDEKLARKASVTYCDRVYADLTDKFIRLSTVTSRNIELLERLCKRKADFQDVVQVETEFRTLLFGTQPEDTLIRVKCLACDRFVRRLPPNQHEGTLMAELPPPVLVPTGPTHLAVGAGIAPADAPGVQGTDKKIYRGVNGQSVLPSISGGGTPREVRDVGPPAPPMGSPRRAPSGGRSRRLVGESVVPLNTVMPFGERADRGYE